MYSADPDTYVVIIIIMIMYVIMINSILIIMADGHVIAIAPSTSKVLTAQVADFFAKLIQRFSPKSYPQALAEVKITQRFLENFSGDSVCSKANE